MLKIGPVHHSRFPGDGGNQRWRRCRADASHPNVGGQGPPTRRPGGWGKSSGRGPRPGRNPPAGPPASTMELPGGQEHLRAWARRCSPTPRGSRPLSRRCGDGERRPRPRRAAEGGQVAVGVGAVAQMAPPPLWPPASEAQSAARFQALQADVLAMAGSWLPGAQVHEGQVHANPSAGHAAPAWPGPDVLLAHGGPGLECVDAHFRVHRQRGAQQEAVAVPRSIASRAD